MGKHDRNAGARAAVACSLLLALASGAGAASRGDGPRGGPRIAVVPFRDLTGQREAVPRVTEEIAAALGRAGFPTADGDRIESFLRERRIRARDAMSAGEARDLAAEAGARYVLVGTIESWGADGKPDVGLTARVIDPEQGAVWWGSVSIHDVEAPGILAMGRARSLDEALPRAVGRLLASLESDKAGEGIRPMTRRARRGSGLIGKKPIVFRARALDLAKTPRVAVLPFDNFTLSPDAPVVVQDHFVSRLFASGRLSVADPGELRRILIERDLQPLLGLDPRDLAVLAEALGIDAVIEGGVLSFAKGPDLVPRVDLFARLRDARTGEVLWSATTTRDGDESVVVYDVGRVRGLDRLVDAAVADLLSTLLK